MVPQPPELHRGPLLAGVSHAAQLAPAAHKEGVLRELNLTNFAWADATLGKVCARTQGAGGAQTSSGAKA